MIVSLIFKVYKPFFLFAVYGHRNNNTAGIDFFGFFLILKFSFLLQTAHCHKRQIHQADEFILPALKNLAVICKILAISLFYRSFVIPFAKCYFLQFRGKCRMTAVV